MISKAPSRPRYLSHSRPATFHAHHGSPLHPTHANTPPTTTFTTKCQPTAHAAAYSSLGLNTVQTNRCTRSAAQAAMTPVALSALNSVRRAACAVKASRRLGPSFDDDTFDNNTSTPARDHQMGPAQLPTKMRRPTAGAEKDETPL